MSAPEIAVLLVTSALCGIIGYVMGYEQCEYDRETWGRDDR